LPPLILFGNPKRGERSCRDSLPVDGKTGAVGPPGGRGHAGTRSRKFCIAGSVRRRWEVRRFCAKGRSPTGGCVGPVVIFSIRGPQQVARNRPGSRFHFGTSGQAWKIVGHAPRIWARGRVRRDSRCVRPMKLARRIAVARGGRVEINLHEAFTRHGSIAAPAICFISPPRDPGEAKIGTLRLRVPRRDMEGKTIFGDRFRLLDRELLECGEDKKRRTRYPPLPRGDKLRSMRTWRGERHSFDAKGTRTI